MCVHTVLLWRADVLTVCCLLLQLYKDAGVPTKNFIGVPVFQAEGLTVTTQDMVSLGHMAAQHAVCWLGGCMHAAACCGVGVSCTWDGAAFLCCCMAWLWFGQRHTLAAPDDILYPSYVKLNSLTAEQIEEKQRSDAAINLASTAQHTITTSTCGC